MTGPAPSRSETAPPGPRDRVTRDYQNRIRAFAAAARAVGPDDEAATADLSQRAAAVLAFLRAWRGLIDSDVQGSLVRALKPLRRRAERARRVHVRAALLASWIGDAPGALPAAAAPLASRLARRRKRSGRRLRARLEPARLSSLLELLQASAGMLHASLANRLAALEDLHRRGRRDRQRAIRAVKRSIERIRFADARGAVRRWHGLASCRVESGLAMASELSSAAEIAEALDALVQRAALRRALAKRLRTPTDSAHPIALVLMEIDAENARWMERLRNLTAPLDEPAGDASPLRLTRPPEGA